MEGLNDKNFQDIVELLRGEVREKLSNIELIIIERIGEELEKKEKNEQNANEKVNFHTEYENDDLKSVLISKEMNEEVYFDCVYTKKKYREKGFAKKLFQKAYETRRYKKAYGYPVTEGSKKIMMSFGFYNIPESEDGVWVNKNYFNE